MAYDEPTAARLRKLLSSRSDVIEKRLMGGLCFMVGGHMCCAVSGRGGLLVRVGPDAYPSMLREPHAAEVEMRGRPMTGCVRVAPEGYASGAGLKKWVTRGVDFVTTLPKRTAAKKSSNARCRNVNEPIKTFLPDHRASSFSSAARPRPESSSAAPAARRY